MKIELFGVLREAAGAAEIKVDVPAPTTIAAVIEALTADYPGLQSHLPRVACAVGDEMRSRTEQIHADETLVLLPPVSGG